MKRIFAFLTLATLVSCDLTYTNWPHLPQNIPVNARIRIGEESQVLENLFTMEEAVRARVWISEAGVWTFIELEYLFDDNLKNITPATPQLRFHALGGAPVDLPLPPGIRVDDLPLAQTEVGGDEDVYVDVIPTARFVPSGDPGLLAIRHTTEGSDRLMMLRSGANIWTEVDLPSGVREFPIRTVGPNLVLVEMGPNRAGVVQNGQLLDGAILLDAFGASPESAYWFGPFDGTDLRMYWSEQAEVLCTGVVNTTSWNGATDGCLNLGTQHAGVAQASGSVQDTVAVVNEQGITSATRTMMTRAQPGKFEILGLGGYTGYRDGYEPTVFAGSPTRPTNTESECTLEANLYSVSRFFQTDGTFGFNRCPTAMPTDICECSRRENPKTCGCEQRMLSPRWIYRTGSYAHTLVAWDKVDARLILRAYPHETDRENRSTLDPKDELKEYDGGFSYGTEIAIQALAPGYQTPLSEMADLTHCSSVAGPNGMVVRNANDTFTVDVRERYTIALDCTPGDGGPPLERFVADFDWSLATGPGFRFPDVVFARGLGVDVPLGALATVHPTEPWMVVSSGTTQLRIGLIGGSLDLLELPQGSGVPGFLSYGQALYEDGSVVDLESGLRLGNLPAGRLARDHRFWIGNDRSLWHLTPGEAPLMLVMASGNILAAAPNGSYIAAENMGVWAYDADGFPASLYVDSPGRILRAGISDDGQFTAIEENRLGSDPPRVRIHTRDDEAPELSYNETFVCENCAMMGFVPATSKVLYYAEQGRLESYDPHTGTTTVLYTGFGMPLPGFAGLTEDRFGRFWWISNQNLMAYDPATDSVLTHAIDAPGGNYTLANFFVDQDRFEGYRLGRQVFGLDETGLIVVYQEQTDATRIVSPLAGDRGYRAGYFGTRNADATDLLSPAEMHRGAFSTPRLNIPRERNAPCVLLQQGPFPDYLTSMHPNYVCAR